MHAAFDTVSNPEYDRYQRNLASISESSAIANTTSKTLQLIKLLKQLM